MYFQPPTPRGNHCNPVYFREGVDNNDAFQPPTSRGSHCNSVVSCLARLNYTPFSPLLLGEAIATGYGLWTDSGYFTFQPSTPRGSHCNFALYLSIPGRIPLSAPYYFWGSHCILAAGTVTYDDQFNFQPPTPRGSHCNTGAPSRWKPRLDFQPPTPRGGHCSLAGAGAQAAGLCIFQPPTPRGGHCNRRYLTRFLCVCRARRKEEPCSAFGGHIPADAAAFVSTLTRISYCGRSLTICVRASCFILPVAKDTCLADVNHRTQHKQGPEICQ